jgi:hypothetical protein
VRSPRLTCDQCEHKAASIYAESGGAACGCTRLGVWQPDTFIVSIKSRHPQGIHTGTQSCLYPHSVIRSISARERRYAIPRSEGFAPNGTTTALGRSILLAKRRFIAKEQRGRFMCWKRCSADNRDSEGREMLVPVRPEVAPACAS